MNVQNNSINLSNLNRRDLIERSSEFIFSTGINDVASKLCRSNMKYGLAQFHQIQEKYGFEPKATFISSPDETITRNTLRWNSGIGYGGKLNWGNGNEKIIFLNVKPNLCGILVGGLDDYIEPHEILQRIERTKEKDLSAKEIPLNWDYQSSNHFINLFKVQNFTGLNLPPYIFFIHGSSPELQNDKYGLGLYIDKSEVLKEMAIEENTKFGKQFILIDNDATEYLNFQYKALKFSKAKREIIAKQLFGKKYSKISNHPHQFLRDYNNMYLGSNCTSYNKSTLSTGFYPIALRADLPAFLLQSKKSFSDVIIENLGFKEKALNLGLLNALMNVNILPHGGGYAFPDISRLIKVIETKKSRFFVCELKKDSNRLKIFSNLKNLQYTYRGQDVILKTFQLDLGNIIAQLNPIYSLKL